MALATEDHGRDAGEEMDLAGDGNLAGRNSGLDRSRIRTGEER